MNLTFFREYISSFSKTKNPGQNEKVCYLLFEVLWSSVCGFAGFNLRIDMALPRCFEVRRCTVYCWNGGPCIGCYDFGVCHDRLLCNWSVRKSSAWVLGENQKKSVNLQPRWASGFSASFLCIGKIMYYILLYYMRWFIR